MNPQKAWKDPKFLGLPPQEKKKVLLKIDSRYQSLPETEQNKVVGIQNEMPWGDVGKQALQNIPESALETGKSLVQPFLHPVETGKALYNLGAGGVQKLIPGEQQQEKHFDSLMGFIKDRYFGIENLKQTMAKDPVGVLTDVASLVTGGGTALKGLGVASKSSKLAALGKATSKAGAVIDPVNLTKQAIQGASKAIPSKLAVKMYKSSAKFGSKFTMEQRNRLVQTGLNKKILPTFSGVNKLSSEIDNLNVKISGLVDDAMAMKQSVKSGELFKGFNKLIESETVGGLVKSPEKDIVKVLDDYRFFDESTKLNPKQLQSLKQSIYKKINNYYEKVKSSPTSVKAQKLIAKNAKELLEEMVPEIKQLNATEGSLINLRNAISDSAKRISNRDLIDFSSVAKAGVGRALLGKVGGAIGIGMAMVDRPVVKARLAITLNTLQKQGVKVSTNAALTRLGLIKIGENWQVQQQEDTQ